MEINMDISQKNLKDPPYDLFIPLPSSQKTLSQHLILMVVYQYLLQLCS